MQIQHYIQWQQNKISLDGKPLFEPEGTTGNDISLSLYRLAALNYTKFFKMDLLSRAAFLAAELVIPATLSTDKNNIAAVISTVSGCLDVDKKFEESRHSLASPALFVYTLPNIMLGEICIRHGFKGEQMCMVSGKADPDWMQFYGADLLQQRGTEACLCGHVEATEEVLSATLLWVSKEPSSNGTALPFTLPNLEQIFTSSTRL